MLHCFSFLPQEKQPNAASPKPAISFSFVVGPTSEKQFFSFTKRYYVWLRVNLTRSHTPKRPLNLFSIVVAFMIVV
jgi:hypothetical protein